MTVLQQCYSLLELVVLSLFDRQLVHEVGVRVRFERVGVRFERVGVRFEGVGVVGESLLE